MEFCPSGTALTLVVTPMSAALGLTDTAARDQLDEPLKVSESGTLGAPVRLLPTPLTPGFVLFPRCTFHCETCGPGTVTVWVPSVARVSKIMLLITLGTSSCEFAPAVPSAETKVPSGTV